MENKTKQKGAMSLMTILGIGFLSLTLTLMASQGALAGLVSAQNSSLGNKSFFSAESAAKEGVYQLFNNLDEGSGQTPEQINGSDNSYTITELSNFQFLVEGEAKNSKTKRKVVNKVTTCPACQAFSYGLFSAGSGLSLTGNAKINGNVYSNNTLELSGNAEIDGDAFAVNEINIVGSSAVITGVEVSGIDPIPSPELDYDFYYNKAENEDSLFLTGDSAEECINDGECDDKVVYIDTTSNVSITINSPFRGSIVTPADLKIKGDFKYLENYPTIATLGTLKILGNTEIEGIVFVEGDIEVTGSNNFITGSVIYTSTGATPTVNGTIEITYDPSYFEDLEAFEGFDVDMIDGDPTIISWTEE